jgi:hypothetical protein
MNGYDYHISVTGKHIIIKVNNKVALITEPDTLPQVKESVI